MEKTFYCIIYYEVANFINSCMILFSFSQEILRQLNGANKIPPMTPVHATLSSFSGEGKATDKGLMIVLWNITSELHDVCHPIVNSIRCRMCRVYIV